MKMSTVSILLAMGTLALVGCAGEAEDRVASTDQAASLFGDTAFERGEILRSLEVCGAYQAPGDLEITFDRAGTFVARRPGQETLFPCAIGDMTCPGVVAGTFTLKDGFGLTQSSWSLTLVNGDGKNIDTFAIDLQKVEGAPQPSLYVKALERNGTRLTGDEACGEGS